MRVGLGRSGVELNRWSSSEVSNKLGFASGSSSIRNWRNGIGGAKDENLDKLISLFTKNEPYAAEWEAVIRNSSQNVEPSDVIRATRKLYFEVEDFGKKKVIPALNNYIEKTDTLFMEDIERFFKDQRPSPKRKELDLYRSTWNSRRQIISGIAIASLLFIAFFIGRATETETSTSKPSTFALKHNQSVVDLKKAIFGNIRFCTEKDFDHDLNQCLKASDRFNVGVQKVNISFESTVLKEGAELELHWYRYGEKFRHRKQRWNEVFAHELQYASTFWSYDHGNGYSKGRYQVMLTIQNEIVGEGIFEVGGKTLGSSETYIR